MSLGIENTILAVCLGEAPRPVGRLACRYARWARGEEAPWGAGRRGAGGSAHGLGAAALWCKAPRGLQVREHFWGFLISFRLFRLGN